MLNIRLKEPELILDSTMVRYYGPYTAVLYAYILSYIKNNQIPLNPDDNYPYHNFIVNRWETLKAVGLTFGQQIDAEKDLIGAFLLDRFPREENKVKYIVYPENIEMVRRDIYSRENGWDFSSE